MTLYHVPGVHALRSVDPVPFVRTVCVVASVRAEQAAQ